MIRGFDPHISLVPKRLPRGFRKAYKNMELPLCYVLAKMEINGIKVDVSYLNAMEEILSNKIKLLEKYLLDYTNRTDWLNLFVLSNS